MYSPTTRSQVHAHVISTNARAVYTHAPQVSLLSVLKTAVTPAYTGRCFASLFLKNCVGNTPLFWCLFMGDLYFKAAQQ